MQSVTAISSKTILLVEDDAGQSRLITMNLQKKTSAHIIAFNSGRKALEYFVGKSFQDLCGHAMILDINMPGVSGFEVLKSLKSNTDTATMPILVFSTTDNHEDVLRAYTEGANMYLVKPLDYTAFINKINYIAQYMNEVTLL